MHSPTKHCRPAREGFTLVELLVVIAIIATLIAMLFPAIQAVRGAARSMSCRSNLRQIGVAVANYESTHQSYPTSYTRIGWSAQAQLLPYLEQNHLYDRFDLSESYKNAKSNMRACTIPAATRFSRYTGSN